MSNQVFKVNNKRMRENYGDLRHLWTAEDKTWATKFELMQDAIEQGHDKRALMLAEELNGKPLTPETTESIVEETRVKQRCNYSQAMAWTRGKAKDRKTTKAVKDNIYDASDWIRNGGVYVDEDDGTETEIGVTVSPESALVDAIDAARSHKVSLEVYMNSPALWEQPRGRGRPKKLESV